MSGAEKTNDEIANGVFHVLHPECPAFPGIPNPCDPQMCDCFHCENLPEKVGELLTELGRNEYWKVGAGSPGPGGTA